MKITEQLEEIVTTMIQTKMKRPKCITLLYEEDDFLKIEQQVEEETINFIMTMKEYNENAISLEKDGQRFDIVRL